MSAPRVLDVAPGSPAALAGVLVDDVFVSLNGEAPRDVIRYQLLVDEPRVELEIDRGGIAVDVEVEKQAGEPLGVEVHSALFDQVRTCDNHCEFCFIYQLPPDLRSSLYLKDDDYRLSFLYGNFTTLTRFTEADLERVVTEGLSPLNVSIHATDPDIRSEMLRNRRGGMSLRWLRALLDHGIQVHGQIVVCPGINDGSVLEDTLCSVLERYADLDSICVVPLGVSKHHHEPRLRAHRRDEAAAVLDTVHSWQDTFQRLTGRRLVHAADEYYLIAERPMPEPAAYEGFAMHEDGVGVARTFEMEFLGLAESSTGAAPGFFAWVEGAPAAGYRAPRTSSKSDVSKSDVSKSDASKSDASKSDVSKSDASKSDASMGNEEVAVMMRPRPDAPVGVLTGSYGASVIAPLLDSVGRSDVRVITVENEFFGGNVAVAGLMVGADLSRVLAQEPEGHRYLLPDVCLSNGRFLDGSEPEDLPRPVEVVPTDGIALRQALGGLS